MSGTEPTHPDRLRIGAAERDGALDRLREALAHERLSMEEFDERADRVLAARTAGDLRELLSDLPVTTAHGAVAARRPRPRWPVRVTAGTVAAVATVVALATGTLPPPDTVAVMGGQEVTVTREQIERGEPLDVYALMGGVEVVVPDGAAVERGGFSVMGGTSCRACEVAPVGGPPVRVNAYALMGGVNIRTVSQPEDDDDDDDD